MLLAWLSIYMREIIQEKTKYIIMPQNICAYGTACFCMRHISVWAFFSIVLLCMVLLVYSIFCLGGGFSNYLQALSTCTLTIPFVNALCNIFFLSEFYKWSNYELLLMRHMIQRNLGIHFIWKCRLILY